MTAFSCPACTKTAMFVRALDRYVHVDGSENLPCWLRIARGETTTPTGLPARHALKLPRARRG